MKKNILLGTHHKTGTVWMGAVFRKFSKLSGIKFYNISRGSIDEKKKETILKDAAYSEEKVIFYDHHSKFPEIEVGTESEFRGIHLIRDPKDLIISAALYHAWSDEWWLHIKENKYGQMTYQEKINSFDNTQEKLEFEMSNSSFHQIKNMSNFDTGNIFINIKFEELMIDKNFYEVMKIARHFELEGEEIIFLLRAFFNESLFGKQKDVKKKHIQPKSKKEEYKKVLELELLDKFNLKFALDTKSLGY